MHSSYLEPKISIVIPVYNTERFLRECMDSVFSQTLSEIEIVCVNDGSTDNCLQMLQDFQQLDPRIRIISQTNAGLSAARNAGLLACRGKYVHFLDSDDFIAPEAMEMLYRRAEETQADIVICNLLLYFDDTGKTASFRDEILYYHLKRKVFTLKEQPEIIACVAAWDRLFLRSFLTEHRFQFPVGLIYEDALFTTETLIKANRIALVPDHLYFYRKNTGGSITDNEAKGIKHKHDFLEVHRRCQAVLRQSNCGDDVWEAYLDLFFRQAIMHHGNSSTPEQFNRFFQEMTGLLTEDIHRLARRSKNEMIVNYAASLREKNYASLRVLLIRP